MVGVRCVVPLNATLLACSTDLVLRSGRWSNGKARGYGGRVPVRDPFQMCVALLHESELAHTDPDPQFFHRPMRYDIGLPSPVI